MKLWQALSVFVFVLGLGTAGPLAAVEPASDPAPAVPHRLMLQSPAEAAVRKALNQPTEFAFTETPLCEVITALKAKHPIEIGMDQKALEEQAIGPDLPITGSAKGVTLRTALRHLLGPHRLAFLVQDHVLLITSQERENERLLTCIYPVEDLVQVQEPTGELRADFGTLVDLITSTVEPPSWQDAGGPGTLTAFENRMCLVIRQTDHAHEQIERLLQGLRQIHLQGELLPVRPHKRSEPAQVSGGGFGGGTFNLDGRDECKATPPGPPPGR